MKFLVEQMLDQLRKHGAARVHPRIVAAPAAAKLPFPERIPNGVTMPGIFIPQTLLWCVAFGQLALECERFENPEKAIPTIR